MNFRRLSFEIDSEHPFARGLVFACLGSRAGGTWSFDSSPFRKHVPLSTVTWSGTFNGRRTMLGGASPPDSVAHVMSFPRYSMGAWMVVNNYLAFNTAQLMGIYDNSNSHYSYLTTWGDATGTKCAATQWGGSTIADPNYITGLGVWYHIASTYDGSTHTLYVNGEYANSQSFATTLEGTHIDIGGSQQSGSDWVNPFGDCLISRRVWSPSEIEQLADKNNVMLSGLIKSRKAIGIGAPSSSTPSAVFMDHQSCILR